MRLYTQHLALFYLFFFDCANSEHVFPNPGIKEVNRGEETACRATSTIGVLSPAPLSSPVGGY